MLDELIEGTWGQCWILTHFGHILPVRSEECFRNQHVFIFTILLSFPEQVLAWEHVSTLYFCGVSRHAVFHSQQHLERLTPPSEQSCVWGEASPVIQGQLVLCKKVTVSTCSPKGPFIHHTWQAGRVKTLSFQQWLESIHIFVLIFKNI